MLNNSSTINKTNNHLSPQPFNLKKTMTYDIGNPGPGLGQAEKYDPVYTCNEFLL
jgi:hypothetical protein